MAPLREQLRLIQTNDIESLELRPDDIANNDDLEEAGRAIRANTSIEQLSLSDFCVEEISTYEPLFLAFSQNESIHTIKISCSDVCEGLTKLFHGQRISTLHFHECDITFDIFAAVAQNMKYLGTLEFFGNCIFWQDHYNRSMKRAKLETVHEEVHVNVLVFDPTRIGRHGIEVVSRFLINPNLTLKEICIKGRWRSDEEWAFSFVNGLKGCKSLEILEYTDAAEQNLILLGSILPHLKLKKLDLSRSCIGAGAATALSYGISQTNHTIEILKLGCLGTTEVALAKIIRACLGPTSRLRILKLFNNNDITDAVMLPLVESLANNTILEELILNQCESVTTIGWSALSRVLGNPRSVLKNLSLWGTSINDDAITAFANSLIDNGTLEELDLSQCNSVTPNGWRALSRVLGSPHSCLGKLEVSYNSINDDIVSAYTNELSENEDSQLWSLALTDVDLITNAIWDPITNLLCNTSSIDATWSSNHTLCELGDFLNDDEVNMPEEVHDLLEMNEDEDKKQVARRKVIKYHFSGDFFVNDIIGIDHKLLPRKISWFGRDSLGLSVVYKIVRTLPELCRSDKG